MARLLQIDDVKARLEVYHNEDDAELQRILDEAEAFIQGYLERRIFSPEEPVTSLHTGGSIYIFLKEFPVDLETLVILDRRTDTEVPATTYEVNQENGVVTKVMAPGSRALVWPHGVHRFEVTSIPGMDQSYNWEFEVKKQLQNAVFHLAADWYENPDPRVISDSLGHSFSKRLDPSAIPTRVKIILDKYAKVF